jgi:RNA polymerase sigma-70 factor (ECF subfamily)
MKPNRPQQLSDEALLDRAREDPESGAAQEAASELFRRYQGRIYQWCFRHFHDYEKALDMAQEVMLNAYKNLGTFGGRASFSSWLFAITRYRCISALRRPGWHDTEDCDPELLVDPRAEPDRGIEAQQEEEEMLRLMREHLEPREQEALCLRVFERMPVDSITQALGITGSTGARSVLQNARRKLRAALAMRSQPEGDDGNV